MVSPKHRVRLISQQNLHGCDLGLHQDTPLLPSSGARRNHWHISAAARACMGLVEIILVSINIERYKKMVVHLHVHIPTYAVIISKGEDVLHHFSSPAKQGLVS